MVKVSRVAAPNTLENCSFQISPYSCVYTRIGIIYEKTNGQIPLGLSLGKQIHKNLVINIPGDPGAVSRVGRKLGRRKFSRTGGRAPGMLLLTNQFQVSFQCLSLIVLYPIAGQHLSRCFPDLLTGRSLPANSAVRCRSAYLSGSFRRAFFEKSFQ